ncbi:MAG TPA: hypothetical protein VFO65_05880, partial [Acidimicrobiales bacterium]|nr:hypothetical protein [Acidimicrobiales bacterium]
TRYLAWIDGFLGPGAGTGGGAAAGPSAWDRERFEYRFDVAAGTAAGAVVLSAPEHQGGHLDWHGFVHDTGASMTAPSRTVPVTATTLPVPAGYAGMPASRFWQLEDSRVDFGGVEAAPTDLARMLVLDFATIYGNDWFVVPLELPVGTVTEVRSLVVGDTFGDQWLVPRVAEPGWSMFELTAVGPGAAAAGGRLGRLFLPPTLAGTLEGEPVEDVLLLRDEGANLAWAVERTVEGAAGTRVDRVEAWHEQRRWRGDAAIPAGAPVPIAPLAYRLRTEVPEHWIPLVPEDAAPGSTRLRVSAFERPGDDGQPVPVLARGRLLEPGTVLLVPEEEVPAEGARLTRSWQYARWGRGTVHAWAARRKRVGRGPGASGLAFDTVEPWRAPGLPLAYETVGLKVTASALGGDPVDLDRLTAGVPVVVRWRVRNAGTEPWRRTGADAVAMGTASARDHPGRLATPTWVSSTRPAVPAESVVGPGQVATFVFEIAAPAGTQPFEEAFDLVAGSRWFDGPGLVLRGRVLAPTPPSVSGAARVGEQLTADPGTWAGTPPFAYAYQWRRCDAGGGAGVDIPGATRSTYVVVADDVGATLRVVVTATDATGAVSAPVASAPTGAVTAVAPANTSPPAVGGPPGTGLTLQATTGTWTGSPPPTFAFQWRRCDAAGGAGVDITGATGPTYVPVAADVGRTLRVVVTAANPGGTVAVTSAPTPIIVVPPASTAPASITGTAEAGSTLTARPGSWSGTSPTLSYRWRRCDATGGGGVDIPGATAATHLLTAADAGSTIRLVVTATNLAGTASSTTAATTVVASMQPPVNTSPPTISGSPVIGAVLTAQEGSWAGSAISGFTYRWQRVDPDDGSAGGVFGATARTYKPGTADEDSALQVVVTATNAAGSASATSKPTTPVTAPAAPANVAPPTISGDFRAGAWLEADPGTWTGSPAPTFGYQWLRCDADGKVCLPIDGATSSGYVPHEGDVVSAGAGKALLPGSGGFDDGDVGSTLRVEVTASNPAGSATTTSDPTPMISAGGGAPPAPEA